MERRGGEGGRRRGEEGGANPEFTIALLAPEVFRMHALAVEVMYSPMMGFLHLPQMPAEGSMTVVFAALQATQNGSPSCSL